MKFTVADTFDVAVAARWRRVVSCNSVFDHRGVRSMRPGNVVAVIAVAALAVVEVVVVVVVVIVVVIIVAVVVDVKTGCVIVTSELDVPGMLALTACRKLC